MATRKPTRRRQSAYGEAVDGFFDIFTAIAGVSPEWTQSRKKPADKRKRR